MNRRTFLKIAGLGSISFAGCTIHPEKNLYSLIHAPEDRVTGAASWYATTCRECPAGCGMIAKNREGRIVKLEGNPFHPINAGKLCMRGQAALQGLYHPDRIRTPLRKTQSGWKAISYARAADVLKKRAGQAVEKGPDRVKMISEVVGEPLFQIFQSALKQWRSEGLLMYEPCAYESQKTANDKILGVDGLVSFRMEKADMLVSFGADFLETWLSPVEYANKFKIMHGKNGPKKGVFFHVGALRSLTAANADFWLACRPGTEVFVALGMIREILSADRRVPPPDGTSGDLKRLCAPYTPERVADLAGISPGTYTSLIHHLKASRAPLILGSGAISPGPHALQTDIAVNIANRLLDPQLRRLCFSGRHRVEIAHRRSEILEALLEMSKRPPDVLIIHRVDLLSSIPGAAGADAVIRNDNVFCVCITDTMDETAALADMIIPPAHYLESWDAYAGRSDLVSFLQPVMGGLTQAPGVGDMFLNVASSADEPADTMRNRIAAWYADRRGKANPLSLVRALGQGGDFSASSAHTDPNLPPSVLPEDCKDLFANLDGTVTATPFFSPSPSIRFFDGRTAGRPWLCEVPDPMTKVAWQTPVLIHPATAEELGVKHADLVRITSPHGELTAPVYETENVVFGLMCMEMGRGGAQSAGRDPAQPHANPVALLSADVHSVSGGPDWSAAALSLKRLGSGVGLAHTDGSALQHGRKIALTVPVSQSGHPHNGKGLAMHEFPLTLPVPRGYDPMRDFYPAHDHTGHRWCMVVDLDRCIGCGACAVACYAENNIGVTGLEGILAGREMSWMRIERYIDPSRFNSHIFFPMMCQHCDNAPCESVCPVYAPHHSPEGLNNQIYNRCIGTRFCSQNCPYKVRRFNWFDWDWPYPLNLQLNPDVTVRSKGVMEKCSFCVQRIKDAHNQAKDENRDIRDGEVVPACVQTCPTNALVFGDLMDPDSRVSKRVKSARAYQAMGYLNTKPAVVYLKKVVWGTRT